MSRTITVRLSKELAEWLAETAEHAGVPPGQVVRDHLEKVRPAGGSRPFMRLAGSLKGLPRDLSLRKGYATRSNR